jgi:hypothetical protein
MVDNRQKIARNLEIYWLYTDLGLPITELADMYDVSRQRIQQILSSHGVSSNNRGGTKISKKELRHPKNDFLTHEELGRKYGLSRHQIANIRGDLQSRNLTDERKFLHNIRFDDKNKCWLWLGGVNGVGYAFLNPSIDRQYYAHHFSFRLFYEYNPDGYILHKCDNKLCVNPHHLYEGTAQDNARDRERNGNWDGPKFSFDIAEEMRTAYSWGRYSYRDLANIYNTTVTSIYRIINRITYASKSRKKKRFPYIRSRAVSNEKVEQMKYDRSSGLTYQSLADKYGVGITTAYNAVNDLYAYARILENVGAQTEP